MILTALAASIALACQLPSPAPERYLPTTSATAYTGLATSPGLPMRSQLSLRTPHDVIGVGGPNLAPGIRQLPYRFVPQPHAEKSYQGIFLGDHRAVRIRIETTVRGKPIAAEWEQVCRKMFKTADLDRDRFLTDLELSHILVVEGLKDIFQGRDYLPGAGATPTVELLDRDTDGRVSEDELVAYYESAWLDMLSANETKFENSAFSNPTSQRLWDALDTNRDGKLSETEVKKLEKLLVTLDENADECLAMSEVLARESTVDKAMMAMSTMTGIMGGANTEQKKPKTAKPGYAVGSVGDLPAEVFSNLLKKYDENDDKVLAGAELPFSPKVVAKLDNNKDGKLSLEEIYALNRLAPDFVIQMNHAEKVEDCTIKLVPHTDLDTNDLTIQSNAPNRIVVRFGRERLDLTSFPMSRLNLSRRFEGVINSILPDGKESVGDAEISGVTNQFLLVVFDVADVNGDGRLTRAELQSFFEMQRQVAEMNLQVTSAAEPVNLFQLLDDNQDGKLGVREMRTAWDRLIVLEAPGSNVITQEVFRPVGSFRMGSNDMSFRAFNEEVVIQDQAPLRKKNGPVWFQRMDRNNDGDVSKAEFLGDKASFQVLDSNNDGLISREEATLFEKSARSK
ncbi:MAG: hypothetical protein ACRC8S_08580 [Fimbriiglobus sp.]